MTEYKIVEGDTATWSDGFNGMCITKGKDYTIQKKAKRFILFGREIWETVYKFGRPLVYDDKDYALKQLKIMEECNL